MPMNADEVKRLSKIVVEMLTRAGIYASFFIAALNFIGIKIQKPGGLQPDVPPTPDTFVQKEFLETDFVWKYEKTKDGYLVQRIKNPDLEAANEQGTIREYPR